MIHILARPLLSKLILDLLEVAAFTLVTAAATEVGTSLAKKSMKKRRSGRQPATKNHSKRRQKA